METKIENKMKVQIKDFQIIKRVNLEFIPGLNVIVGPSNNGKSSILKAIKALLYTTPGSTPIRSGQSSYVVGINYNGHTILLQKGLKESAYLVDGEKYTKFGTTTPQAVIDALQIKELELNGKKEQLNFWDQLNYPFLLDKTPVELFRFIVDSGDDDQITKALKNMVSDRQGLTKKIDQLQGTINAIDLDIDTYSTQLEQAKSVLETCDRVIDLLPRIGKLKQLKDSKQTLDSIKVERERIKSQQEKSKINELNNLSQNIKQNSSKYNLFKDYSISLKSVISSIQINNTKMKSVNKIKDLNPINIQNLPELKQIRDTINYITNSRKSIKIKPVITCAISRDDLNNLHDFKNKLENLQRIKNALAFNNIEKEKVNRNIIFYRDTKSLFKICPLCGNKIH